jgi:thioesterase domain-containing protein
VSTEDSVPTLASLADSLWNGQESRPKLPPLLKPGKQRPPIFMAHGIGDTILQIFGLASCLEISNPVYGLQSQGIDGRDKPLTRIEEMAEFHIASIRRLQPEGPYFLVGYSLGGLIVLEMAQRLREMREPIGLLMMLDSYPAARHLALGQRILLTWRALRSHAEEIIRPARPGQESEAGFSTESEAVPFDSAKLRLVEQVKAGEYRAWQNYRPHFYRGSVKFVRASIRSSFATDPAASWRNLTGKFEVESVPGNHFEMLSTRKENVAAAITRGVKEGLAQLSQ